LAYFNGHPADLRVSKCPIRQTIKRTSPAPPSPQVPDKPDWR